MSELDNINQYLDYLNTNKRTPTGGEQAVERFFKGAGDLVKGAGSEVYNDPFGSAGNLVTGAGTGAVGAVESMVTGLTGKRNPFGFNDNWGSDSNVNKIAQGIGSFAPYLGAGAAGVAARVGALAPTVGVGALQGHGDVIDRVDDPSNLQRLLGIVFGGTQGLVPTGILRGLGGKTKAANAFRGATGEAIQETAYTAGQDWNTGTRTSPEEYGEIAAISALAGGGLGAAGRTSTPTTSSPRIEPELVPRADIQEDYSGEVLPQYRREYTDQYRQQRYERGLANENLPAIQGSREITPYAPLPNPEDAYIEHAGSQYGEVLPRYSREHTDPIVGAQADYEQGSPTHPTVLSNNSGIIQPETRGELIPREGPNTPPPIPTGNSTGADLTGQSTRNPADGASGGLPINGRATRDFNEGDGNKSVRDDTVKLTDLAIDPETYQFRAKADGKTGDTNRLDGVETWKPTAADKVMVFEDSNGRRFIVDGHHRALLARKKQAEDPNFNSEVEAYIFSEADGWKPQEVRKVAAESNIRQGNADAVDVAVALSGNTLKEIREKDFPTSGRDFQRGVEMRNLSPEALSHVIRGHISDADGAAIGRLVTDPQKQVAAAETFMKRQPTTESERFRLAGLVANSGTSNNPEAADLFGEGGLTSRADITLDVLGIADRVVKSNKNLAASLLKKAGTIDKNNLGTVDEKESAKQKDELTMIQKLLNGALYAGEEADFMKSLIAKMPENQADISQGDLRNAAEEYIKFLGKPPAKASVKADTPIERFTDSDTVQPEPEKKKVDKGPSDEQRYNYMLQSQFDPLYETKTVEDFDERVEVLDNNAEEFGIDKDASYPNKRSKATVLKELNEVFKSFGLDKSEIDNVKSFFNALSRESFPNWVEDWTDRSKYDRHKVANHNVSLGRRIGKRIYKDPRIASAINLADAREFGIPNSSSFFHEMAHHLYQFALSHNERKQFYKLLRDKHFDSKGKRIDNPYQAENTNYDSHAEEVFAHEFQRYAYRRFTPKEQQSWDFWKKLVNKYVKPLFDWMTSAKRDTDYDEIFKKLLPETTASTPVEGGKKQTDIFDTPEGRGFGNRQVELDDAVIEAGGKPGTLSETETSPEPEKKSKPKQKEDPGPIFHSMTIFSNTDRFADDPTQKAIKGLAEALGLGLSARAVPDIDVPVSSLDKKTVFINTAKRPDTSVGKNWYSGFQDIVGHLFDSNKALSQVFNGDPVEAQEWFHDYAMGQGGTDTTAKVMGSLSKKQKYALERFKLTLDESSNFKQAMNYLKNYPAPMRNAVARAGEYVRDSMFDGLAPLRRAIAEKVQLSVAEYEHILSLIKRTPQGGQIGRAIMGITGVPRLKNGSFIYEPNNKSLKDIFSKVKSKDLETFSKVVRAYELLASNDKNIDQSQINAAHRALNGNEHMKETADELFQYFDDLAELAIDAGVIPRETYDKMKLRYPKYAPQFKVSDDVSSSFFQRTGSQSAMERVDIAAQDHTRNVIGKVNKTIAARALVNTLVSFGGSEKIAEIEDITKDSREVKEDFGIVRKGGKDGDLYMVVPDENGVKHSYHITDPVMADAVMFMIQGRDIPAILQWSRGMKKWTQSVISLLPQFQILVAGKEIVSAQLVGKAGGKPFIPPDLKAFTDAVKSNSGWGKSDLPVATMEALLNGGITGLNSIEITPKVKLGKGLDTDFMSWLDSFSNAVLGTAHSSEAAMRQSSYNRNIKDGDSPVVAAYKSNQNADYSQVGNSMAAMIVDSVIPFGRIAFTDAALVTDTIKETGKDIKNIAEGTASKTVKQRTFRRLAWFSALFSMALASALHQQDDEEAQDISARSSAFDMFVFPYTDENGVQQAIRIPHTFGPGAVVGALANGLAAVLQSDEGKKDKSIQKVGWILAQGFIPGLHNIMPYELAKDIFTDASLTFDNRGLDTNQQVGKTKTGTDIAQSIGMSPDRLEAIMDDVFPGLAALGLAAVDKWVYKKPKRPFKEQVLGRFRTDYNYDDAVKRYYTVKNGGRSVQQVDEANWRQFLSERKAGANTNINDIKKEDPERYVAITFGAKGNNDIVADMNDWQHTANIMRDRAGEAKTALKLKQAADTMVRLAIGVNRAFNNEKKGNGKDTHNNVTLELNARMEEASQLPKESDRMEAYNIILNRAYKLFFNAKVGVYMEVREKHERQVLQ